jgi:hypothetical protein
MCVSEVNHVIPLIKPLLIHVCLCFYWLAYTCQCLVFIKWLFLTCVECLKKLMLPESASKLASVLGQSRVWFEEASQRSVLYEALGQLGHKDIDFALKLCTTNPLLDFN